MDERREQCREEPGLYISPACSTNLGALLVAHLPNPCLGSWCLPSQWCLPMPSALCWCPTRQLAEKGLQSTPCPPAVPWIKARKWHMPWFPLMHFSSSHRSALCQFSSFAVRERAEQDIGVQEHPQESPPDPPSIPPASLIAAAGGQRCCEPGDQQITLKWEFWTGLWDGCVVFARMQVQPAHVGESLPTYRASSPCKHPSFFACIWCLPSTSFSLRLNLTGEEAAVHSETALEQISMNCLFF